MTCPFLSETRVRYCHASPIRKMIAAGSGDEAAELCSTPAYKNCRVFQEHGVENGHAGTVCPYRHESLAHYCSAAATRQFIPFSEQAGRCGGSGFRFCELYLGLERAGEKAFAPRTGDIRVPAELFYAPNHMWLHVGPNGACHVGVDEFFAFVAGTVDELAFVTTTGIHRPSAVLSVAGVDWPISFRNRMLISSAHLHLRSNPAPVATDPYGSGWLFEGWELPDVDVKAGLMSGAQALDWMQQERARLDAFVHEQAAVHHVDGNVVVNDGGSAAHEALRHLGREETLRMLHAFFSPDRAWEEEPVR